MQIPDITVCMVATRAHELSYKALRSTLNAIKPGDCVVFSDVDGRDDQHSAAWRYIPIHPLSNTEEYSEFVLKNLTNQITTSHALIIQWDGFVINPTAWSSDFLDFDYIGAPWPQFQHHTVGNGGFSLRSKRLLECLADPEIILSHPEDLCICRSNRQLLEDKHAIRFAPADVAEHFSVERHHKKKDTFGFHGIFNIPDLFSPSELGSMLKLIPRENLTSRDARDLALRLAQIDTRKYIDFISSVSTQRIRSSRLDIKDLYLALQWAAAKLFIARQQH